MPVNQVGRPSIHYATTRIAMNLQLYKEHGIKLVLLE